MVETLRRAFAVTATGVGRKDWSQNVEYSTEQLIRSHQVRITWNYRYLYYGIPFPESIVAPLTPSIAQAGAPVFDLFGMNLFNGVATYVSEVVLSTLTQNLVYVDVEVFDSYDQLLGLPTTVFGGSFGYGNIEVKFTKPIKWEIGKIMGIRMSVFDPTWPLVYYDITVSGIVDRVADIGLLST